jgi:hypothetical protein
MSYITHNMTKTRLYGVWKNMRRRCHAPHCSGYKNYGGRGISVCDEWRYSFEAFRDWALANGYKEDISLNNHNKITIDRINNDGNYEPDNCRWVSEVIQNLNMGMFSTNTSGHKGVSFHKGTNRWRAFTSINNKYVHIGAYRKIEDAIEAREKYMDNLLSSHGL